ncbi:MAG: hypothetical protein GW941_01555 [Candidatus Pacebacteria bacterium]|nr:hypothetical protein [Candidatus Paceibacterota bacterium]
MNKIFKKLSLVFILNFIVFFVFLVNPALAIDNDDINNDCRITIGGVETSLTTNDVPNLLNEGSTGNLTYFGRTMIYTYEVIVCPGDFSILTDDLTRYSGNNENIIAYMSTTGFNFQFGGGRATTILTPNDNGCLTGTFDHAASSASKFSIDIESQNSRTPICRREHGQLSINSREEETDYSFDEAISDLCNSLTYSPPNPTIEDTVEITADIPLRFFSSSGMITTPDGKNYSLDYQFKDSSGDVIDEGESISRNISDLAYTRFVRTYVDLPVTSYTFDLFLHTENRGEDIEWCSKSFSVGTINSPGRELTGDVDEYSICESNLSGTALSSCISCYDTKGIWTAIGCISQDPKNLVSKLINIGIGILGGIFLLRVLAASFMLTTSQGDVKKTSEAKQMISEAIIGVLFIIFSVTILQFIGSDVLRIPGFGS